MGESWEAREWIVPKQSHVMSERIKFVRYLAFELLSRFRYKINFPFYWCHNLRNRLESLGLRWRRFWLLSLYLAVEAVMTHSLRGPRRVWVWGFWTPYDDHFAEPCIYLHLGDSWENSRYKYISSISILVSFEALACQLSQHDIVWTVI